MFVWVCFGVFCGLFFGRFGVFWSVFWPFGVLERVGVFWVSCCVSGCFGGFWGVLGLVCGCLGVFWAWRGVRGVLLNHLKPPTHVTIYMPPAPSEEVSCCIRSYKWTLSFEGCVYVSCYAACTAHV